MADIQKVAIIGASTDRSKYGNRAVRGFIAAGYDVYPINPNCTQIEGIKCYHSLNDLPVTPDIITVYTPPRVTEKLVEHIAKVPAKEVYFNPGSENPRVKELTVKFGLDTIFACSVVARAFFTD